VLANEIVQTVKARINHEDRSGPREATRGAES
jgi:hypothetical protein